MKLATFNAGGADQLGVVDGTRVISLSRAAPALAANMIDLITRWSMLEAEARRIAGEAAHVFALDKVLLKAPIPRPGKIMAIGLNYADHVAETGATKPEHQIWFAKMPTAINGPYDDIQIPKAGKSVDYEAELVAVIGGGGRHIAKDAASQSVFGYCCGNDVSERDWQKRTPQWILGKSFDTHAPTGPWITTAEEAGDPHRLGISCLVNGQTRQDSNTGNLVFTVWDQIAHLSKVMTLEPGDLIFTGTPGGVGMAMKPPKYLKAGDRVRVEIEKLGALDARCVDE
jgi:ureidoglycolate lyase